MNILDSVSSTALVKVIDGGNEALVRVNQVGSGLLSPFLTLTGSTSLTTSMAGALIPVDSASPVDITVGANSSPIGTVYTFKRLGDGPITFVESGVTITASSGSLTDAGINVYTSLIKTGADTYDLQNGMASVTGTWTPVFTGFSADPTPLCGYVLMGKLCYIFYNSGGNGTSNATTFTMTLPFTAANTTGQISTVVVRNNGIDAFGRATTTPNTNILTFSNGAAPGVAFTASGSKTWSGSFIYEIA